MKLLRRGDITACQPDRSFPEHQICNRRPEVPPLPRHHLFGCYASPTAGHLIGDAAKNQVAMNPFNTIFDAKRLIGRRFSDASVQSYIKHWPFKVIAGPGDKPMIVVQYKGEKEFSAEEISSMVLMKMREIAEAYLGSNIKNAVVTVPALKGLAVEEKASSRVLCCEEIDGRRWNYIVEVEGSGGLRWGSALKAVSLQTPAAPMDELASFIRSYVVPEGFPDSVTPFYVPYMQWRALKHFCGGAMSVFTTRTLLSSVGVSQTLLPPLFFRLKALVECFTFRLSFQDSHLIVHAPKCFPDDSSQLIHAKSLGDSFQGFITFIPDFCLLEFNHFHP